MWNLQRQAVVSLKSFNNDQLPVESYILVGPTLAGLAGLAVLISFMFLFVSLGKHSIYRVRFKLARFPLITSCWRAEPSRSHGKQGVIKRLLYQWKKKHKQKHKDENKTNEPLPLRYRGTPMNKDGPDCQACALTHALSLFVFCCFSATSSSPFCLFLGSFSATLPMTKIRLLPSRLVSLSLFLSLWVIVSCRSCQGPAAAG
jgi:hypothetical protein